MRYWLACPLCQRRISLLCGIDEHCACQRYHAIGLANAEEAADAASPTMPNHDRGHRLLLLCECKSWRLEEIPGVGPIVHL